MRAEAEGYMVKVSHGPFQRILSRRSATEFMDELEEAIFRAEMKEHMSPENQARRDREWADWWKTDGDEMWRKLGEG